MGVITNKKYIDIHLDNYLQIYTDNVNLRFKVKKV